VPDTLAIVDEVIRRQFGSRMNVAAERMLMLVSNVLLQSGVARERMRTANYSEYRPRYDSSGATTAWQVNEIARRNTRVFLALELP
jgi:type IV pilus biogenesis protein CpaD/CtpE